MTPRLSFRCPKCHQAKGQPVEATIGRPVSFLACQNCGHLWKSQWPGVSAPDAESRGTESNNGPDDVLLKRLLGIKPPAEPEEG